MASSQGEPAVTLAFCNPGYMLASPPTSASNLLPPPGPTLAVAPCGELDSLFFDFDEADDFLYIL